MAVSPSMAQASSKKQRHLKEYPLRGNEIVDNVVCLCAVNLYLHGIGGDECSITAKSRWRSFSYEELIARDKTNLEIFWLKDESLEDTENLPPPEV